MKWREGTGNDFEWHNTQCVPFYSFCGVSDFYIFNDLVDYDDDDAMLVIKSMPKSS